VPSYAGTPYSRDYTPEKMKDEGKSGVGVFKAHRDDKVYLEDYSA